MPLQVVTNTAWRDSQDTIYATGATHLEGAAENITYGPRFLTWKWKHFGAGEHMQYQRSDNAFAFDTLVLAGARSILGQTLEWRSYDGTDTTVHATDTPASGDMVGINSEDYILQLDTEVTGARRVGVTFTALVHPVKLAAMYIGTAHELSEIADCRIERANRYSSSYLKRVPYAYCETANIVCEGVSTAEYQAFEQLYRVHTDPVFVYDPNGDYFRDQLWHCIIGPTRVVEKFNDLYTLSLSLYRLRAYPDNDHSN